MRTLQPFVAHGSGVSSLTIGRKSAAVLATGGEDMDVNVWRVGRPTTLLSCSMGQQKGSGSGSGCVTALSFDPQEELLAAGSGAGAVKVFDLGSGGKLRRAFGTGHRSAVSCIDHHPHGSGFLVTGSVDTNIKVWDSRRKECLATYRGHDSATTCVRMSPDGTLVASGAASGAVRIWDLRGGKLMKEFATHRGKVTDLCFHPNEFLLASSGQDRQVHIWDLDAVGLLSSSPHEKLACDCLEFSADGAALCAVSREALKTWRWEPAMSTIDTMPGEWGIPIADMKIAHRQQQIVLCGYSESFVSTWVVDMGDLRPFGERQSLAGNKTKDSGPPPPAEPSTPPARMHSPSKLSSPSHQPRESPVHFDSESVGGRAGQKVDAAPENNPEDSGKVHMPARAHRDVSTGMGQSFKDHVSAGSKTQSNNAVPFLPPPKYDASPTNASSRKPKEDVGQLAGLEEQLQRGSNVTDILSARLREVQVVATLWQQGKVRTVISHLERLVYSHPSAALDAFRAMNIESGAFNVEACVSLFPVLHFLLAEHCEFDESAEAVMHAIRSLFKGVASIIQQNLCVEDSVGKGGGTVDVSREERTARCSACATALEKIIPEVSKMRERPGSVGQTASELTLLLQKFNRRVQDFKK